MVGYFKVNVANCHARLRRRALVVAAGLECRGGLAF